MVLRFFYVALSCLWFQSRASLVSSSDGGILAEGETSSSEASGDSTSPPCDLGLYERLLLTHPVWFLPGIQRAGAVHLLQGKEEGVSFSVDTNHNIFLENLFISQRTSKTVRSIDSILFGPNTIRLRMVFHPIL